jgi:transcriptional regulator with XRE-family HTH domain
MDLQIPQMKGLTLMAAPGADTFPGVEMFALIGETLRRLRRDKGLTLEELGKAAELGRGQLSRIENSRQEATLSTLAKILSSQGVSRREFFRRYDLVESEALLVERQQAGGAAAGEAEGEGNWPQEIQDVLNRVESFVDATLHQPRPVAQGAVEVGDLVVLFRVVPKHPDSGPPQKPGEPAAPPKPPAPGTKRRPAARRKR